MSDTSTTSAATASYTELAQRLSAVADAVDRPRWRDPSPCDGWSAADVIGHLIDTQRGFLTRHDVALPPATEVDDDPARAWRRHAARVAEALARPGVADATFDGFFGPATIGATIARFYGFDMIVHRWDVARATGVPTSFSPAELDQIETSIDGFGEHLYADGICAPAVPIPASSSRQDQLLARMGRDPR